MEELNKNEQQKGYGPAASLGIVCGGIAVAIVALLLLQKLFM
jgi:hypothetical protein